MAKIKITINDQEIECQPGTSIMAAARSAGIYIPALCSHPDFEAKANCRICAVEIEGRGKLQTACSTEAADGMVVRTDTDRVRQSRNLNIELIFAEHIEKCADCVWRFQCPLLGFAEKYKILITTFKDRKGSRKTHKFANAVEIDGSQCIDCRNCIDACSVLQNIHYLELKGRGTDQEVVPAGNKERHCILCGQCAVHCPVSAAQEQTHWEMVEKAIKNKNKVVVAQFAPSIRVSIGEDFGLPYGRIVTGNVAAGLRALGFDHVFDVNFSADITTIIEAEELLERINQGRKGPMITSCCPGWVNYAEFYHPELLQNLTTARSPHIHGGGIIKTYWAKKMGIDPKRIIVVSIMPCTAKKYEAARPEMKINNMYPVDYVLTTREFSFMMKRQHIDFPSLKKEEADDPLGEFSGGAAIFGGSGGVMESALRTAHFLVCGDSQSGLCNRSIEFNEVRGLDGFKSAAVNIGKHKLRVGIVNGIGHIEPVLARLEDYDYLEVMACPGGCIGGGGQPIPTTAAIRQKRIAALYRLDKKSRVRRSHDNEGALKVLAWLAKRGKRLEKSVLHTRYQKRAKY